MVEDLISKEDNSYQHALENIYFSSHKANLSQIKDIVEAASVFFIA